MTTVEEFRTEVKGLSRVLLVLSVAIITVISSVHNPTEDVNWINGLAKIVIGGQLVSIFCGVLLQKGLIKLSLGDYKVENGLSEESSNDKLAERISLYDKAQIFFFMASLLLSCLPVLLG